MSQDELKAVLDQRPFMPVKLHLSNGRSYEIRHPEMALISKRMAAIEVNEIIHLVSLIHINDIVPLSAAS